MDLRSLLPYDAFQDEVYGFTSQLAGEHEEDLGFACGPY